MEDNQDGADPAREITPSRTFTLIAPSIGGAPFLMQKIVLDNLNSISSVEWRHRGYAIQLDPNPTAYEVGNQLYVNKYQIWNPEELAMGNASTLNDACEIIDALAEVGDEG